MNTTTKWILILITFIILAWALFGLELWAKEWKDLFFYMDNWLLFVGLLIFVMIAKKIAEIVLKAEVRTLK